MPDDLQYDDYIAAFRAVFGMPPRGPARLWIDAAGQRVVISDDLFIGRDGQSKLMKGVRRTHAALLAETIVDPDEIWLGVKVVSLPGGDEHILTRRYIRADASIGTFVTFDLGRKFWTSKTGFQPARNFQRATGTPSKTNWNYLHAERVGRLLWKRK